MSESKYFYIENGTQTGPVTAEELVSRITPNTDIWCPGMANWAPANTVPEVSALFGGGMAAPAQDGFNSASSQYDGGNSQNYGSNQNYADPQQQPYGTQQQPYGTQQPYGQPQPYGNAQQQPYGNAQQPYGNAQQPYGNAQQPYGQQQPAGTKPDNYLVWAIVCTLLCCWPIGIVSIVNAAKVDSAWNKGDYAEAQKCSDNAKKFAIISAVCGVVVLIIYACLAAAGSLG